MSTATKLIDEIREFARRKPDHSESTARLVRAIERIDSEFEGEVREQLLAEARSCFRKQLEALETAAQTRASLMKLKENQRELVETLKRIALEQRAGEDAPTPRRRIDGATLH
jgi:dynactin complex subunit